MSSAMWMFQGNADADADVEMMLEHRADISEMLKVADKVFNVGRCSTAFEQQLPSLKEVANQAKVIVAKHFSIWFVTFMPLLHRISKDNARAKSYHTKNLFLCSVLCN